MGFWSERILFGVATLLSVQVTMWAGLKDSDCLECHSDKTLSKTNAAGKEILLFVDPAKLASSGITLEDIRSILVASTTNAAKGTINTPKSSSTTDFRRSKSRLMDILIPSPPISARR